MNALYFRGNRQRLYAAMEPGSLLVIFSGAELRRTWDEYYPFFAERNFVYLTGLSCKEAILFAAKESGGTVTERLYILPKDPMAERWTGRRITPFEAEAISAVADIRTTDAFGADFAAERGNYSRVYLDLERCAATDQNRASHFFEEKLTREYPQFAIADASRLLRQLRLIKQPCESDALREAEKKTRAGILAMMRSSRPGIYEYQLKAEYDRAPAQFGPEGSGFPPIISAGDNNFCIHYYSYTGQAMDGDMVLNDVGGQHENLITDVSRGWPCNGKFTEKQKLLYECALATSDHLFSIIRPGMKMEDVDATIRRYNFEQLKDAGVLEDFEEIGTYMWHGGSHHIGYDVHDVVQRPEILAPGMAFCVDVGIYHEQWGIGFRLEDNCLVTETGCENLSREIPRTVADIESVMGRRF